MRRFLLACAVSTVTAGGLWALPVADGAPTPTSVVADEQTDVDAPNLETPKLSAARQVGAEVASPTPSAVVPSATQPSHLADAPEPPSSVPAEIVTVTTTVPAPPPPPALVPPPSTAPPAPTVAFTASQAYGSCSEPVPYDIFSGTAHPGSTVTISSPHGSGSTVADFHGHWERTVEFPGAPRGETFAVSVAGVGGSTTLSFTATGDDGAHA